MSHAIGDVGASLSRSWGANGTSSSRLQVIPPACISDAAAHVAIDGAVLLKVELLESDEEIRSSGSRGHFRSPRPISRPYKCLPTDASGT